jgi:hypothetical protein
MVGITDDDTMLLLLGGKAAHVPALASIAGLGSILKASIEPEHVAVASRESKTVTSIWKLSKDVSFEGCQGRSHVIWRRFRGGCPGKRASTRVPCGLACR